MSANLQPQMPAIKDWLKDAMQQLSKIGISSASLDAEIILANTLNKDRVFLHTHYNDSLNPSTIKVANGRLKRRLNHMPIAYIVGHKEFYGRKFTITPSVLIPRPESETIIEILKKIIDRGPPGKQCNTELVDVGTGSGILGITSKLEFPWLDVTLTDVYPESLEIASLNAKQLSSDVKIIQSNLLDNYLGAPDIIVGNLPYVDRSWKRSPETDYEPSSALFANSHGLELIEGLITQSSNKLKPNGHIIIEADPTQHAELIEYANSILFELTHQIDYVIAFKLNK